MGHQSYVLLCSKMTSFPPSEGVSEITFGSICSRSLWIRIQTLKAVNEMVPDLIWAPDFFGPEKLKLREIWSLHENHYMAFSWPKFLRAQISWGPKMSGAQMRLGTISVTAPQE